MFPIARSQCLLVWQGHSMNAQMTYCVSRSCKRFCATSACPAPGNLKSLPKPDSTRIASCDFTEGSDLLEKPQKPRGRKTAKDANPNSSGQDTMSKPKKNSSGKDKTKRELMEDHIRTEPPQVQSILSQFSEQLIQCKVNPSAMYTVDERIAASVAAALDPAYHHVPHLELGAGPGVLTRALLTAGVTDITCFETNKAFHASAEALSQEFGVSIRVTQLNLMSLPKFVAAAQLGEGSRLHRCLQGIQPTPWDGPQPCLRLVGVMHHIAFFRYMMRSVLHRQHMFQFGRPEMVVFVKETEFQRMTAMPEHGSPYKPFSILTQLLFDVEELDRFPACHFYPWVRPQKRLSVTDGNFVLLRYRPKRVVGVPVAELPRLVFFVQHCAASQRRRLLHQLEKWVPGCGPRLIRLGLQVFAPTRSLTPQQLLHLFQEFSAWPEYTACPFQAAASQGPLEEEHEEHELAHMSAPPQEHFEEDTEDLADESVVDRLSAEWTFRRQ